MLLFEGILIMLVYLRCLTGFPTSLGGREYQGCSFFCRTIIPIQDLLLQARLASLVLEEPSPFQLGFIKRLNIYMLTDCIPLFYSFIFHVGNHMIHIHC